MSKPVGLWSSMRRLLALWRPRWGFGQGVRAGRRMVRPRVSLPMPIVTGEASRAGVVAATGSPVEPAGGGRTTRHSLSGTTPRQRRGLARRRARTSDGDGIATGRARALGAPRDGSIALKAGITPGK